ncbi:PGF-CTERM sorting domain-containing protein [Sodalis glossinidius]
MAIAGLLASMYLWARI